MIEACEAWVHRNTILENNDGIVCLKSIPSIDNNYISKNKSNGI